MSTQKRKQLFHNIVRLRNAEQEAPEAGLELVREDLERELGETVSKHLAAELLGVTHTALNRWVDRGDIPLVINREGRLQIPVPVVIDLYERIEQERAAGRRRLHVLEPVMRQARDRAERLRPHMPPAEELGGPDPHRRAERRALAYHRAVAQALTQPIVDEARRRVHRWEREGKLHPGHADAWKALLDEPAAEIRRRISADTPAGRDLRQNSPFAGVLSEPERRKILESLG